MDVNDPMAQIYKTVVFRNEIGASDDFGLRGPLIQIFFWAERGYLYRRTRPLVIRCDFLLITRVMWGVLYYHPCDTGCVIISHV